MEEKKFISQYKGEEMEALWAKAMEVEQLEKHVEEIDKEIAHLEEFEISEELKKYLDENYVKIEKINYDYLVADTIPGIGPNPKFTIQEVGLDMINRGAYLKIEGYRPIDISKGSNYFVAYFNGAIYGNPINVIVKGDYSDLIEINLTKEQNGPNTCYVVIAKCKEVVMANTNISIDVLITWDWE